MREFAAREIGARIAQARHESGGMTQVELADALNVSQRSVQDFEAGKTIPWKYFTRLEQIFGRNLNWFLTGDEERLHLEEVLEEVAATNRQMVTLLEELVGQQPLREPPEAASGQSG